MLYCKDAPESGNVALLPRRSAGTERLMAKNGEWRVKCNRKDVPKMEHCLCNEVRKRKD